MVWDHHPKAAAEGLIFKGRADKAWMVEQRERRVQGCCCSEYNTGGEGLEAQRAALLLVVLEGSCASSSFFLSNLCVMPQCFATVGFKIFKVFLINEGLQRKKAVFMQGNWENTGSGVTTTIPRS